MTERQKPFVIELEPGDPPADPGLAPEISDLPPEGRAMQGVALVAGRKTSALSRFAFWVFTSLFTLVLSVAAWNFVTGLFVSNALLGWIAFVLVILAVLILVIFAGREAMGFARLARLDHLRIEADRAHLQADLPAARAVTLQIRALYAGRADTAWGEARFAGAAPDVMDADALLELAEAEIIAPLDARAETEIEAGARKVALVTALVPLALADVAVALYANLTMIRRIAEIYGGRSGALGSWRLMRRVFATLLAAGAVSLADDMIGSVAGGGILSKVSRRFGEGVVNGALTARVGVAAMETCRPLPFRVAARPSVSALVSRAVTGLIPKGS